MFCKKCGKEIMDDAVVCVHCGCSVQPIVVQTVKADVPSVGLVIVSFLIPLVGLIAWLANMGNRPISAKLYGKMCWLGILLEFVLGLAIGLMAG